MIAIIVILVIISIVTMSTKGLFNGEVKMYVEEASVCSGLLAILFVVLYSIFNLI